MFECLIFDPVSDYFQSTNRIITPNQFYYSIKFLSNLFLFYLLSSKLLQDIGLNFNTASTSEWLTGGAVGTRGSMLVFKTIALTRNTRDDDDSDDSPNASSSLTEKCRFPPVVDAKSSSSIAQETVKRLVAPNFDIHRKSMMKSSVSTSVSSSSENSISSACEDPSDLDAHIIKIEKSTKNQKKPNRLLADQLKSRFNTAEDSEHETKSVSPSSSEHAIDESNATDEMPAAMLKMTYKFTNTETKLLKRILSSHGLKEAKEYEKFNLLWTGLHMKPDILRSLMPFQRVNHFPR